MNPENEPAVDSVAGPYALDYLRYLAGERRYVSPQDYQLTPAQRAEVERIVHAAISNAGGIDLDVMPPPRSA